MCTVRCRNAALAGPFGGCFAVQQTDTEPHVNTPQGVETADTLEFLAHEVASNQAAFPAAVEANKNAGASGAEQRVAEVNAILGLTTTLVDAPTQTPSVILGGGG